MARYNAWMNERLFAVCATLARRVVARRPRRLLRLDLRDAQPHRLCRPRLPGALHRRAGGRARARRGPVRQLRRAAPRARGDRCAARRLGGRADARVARRIAHLHEQGRRPGAKPAALAAGRRTCSTTRRTTAARRRRCFRSKGSTWAAPTCPSCPGCERRAARPRANRALGLAGAQPRAIQPSLRSDGNRITSRMLGESVSSITSRSMPMPQPPVGGMPISSARMKSAS